MKNWKKNLKMIISAFITLAMCLFSGKNKNAEMTQAAVSEQSYSDFLKKNSSVVKMNENVNVSASKNSSVHFAHFRQFPFFKKTICRLRSPCVDSGPFP